VSCASRCNIPGHRLAISGDSFVFGVVPRSENVTSVVERLASESGRNVEVLNMGLPAAGPRNYVGMIGKDAADLHVDIVGVVLFLGNDVLQAHPDFVTRLWLGAPREVLVSPYASGWSAQYLSLYRMLRESTRPLRERVRADSDGAFSRESFLAVEAQRSVVFAADPSDFVRDSLASVVQITQQMQAVATARQMQFFVVLAPDELQVDTRLQTELFSADQLQLADYDFGRLPCALQRKLEAAGIPVLDLLPRFAAEVARELYARHDTHWNEAGNALAGVEIWEFIERRLLSPPPGVK
jgi:hypothetical protein